MQRTCHGNWKRQYQTISMALCCSATTWKCLKVHLDISSFRWHSTWLLCGWSSLSPWAKVCCLKWPRISFLQGALCKTSGVNQWKSVLADDSTGISVLSCAICLVIELKLCACLILAKDGSPFTPLVGIHRQSEHSTGPCPCQVLSPSTSLYPVTFCIN